MAQVVRQCIVTLVRLSSTKVHQVPTYNRVTKRYFYIDREILEIILKLAIKKTVQWKDKK